MKEIEEISKVKSKLPMEELADMKQCRNKILNILKQHGATSVLSLTEIFYEFQSGILREDEFYDKSRYR